MKSDQVTKALKDGFNVATNEEIMPAVQAALGAKTAPPLGVTVILANGQITSVPFGLSNPATLAEIEALQRTLHSLVDALDKEKVTLIRAEVTAQLTVDKAPGP